MSQNQESNVLSKLDRLYYASVMDGRPHINLAHGSRWSKKGNYEPGAEYSDYVRILRRLIDIKNLVSETPFAIAPIRSFSDLDGAGKMSDPFISIFNIKNHREVPAIPTSGYHTLLAMCTFLILRKGIEADGSVVQAKDQLFMVDGRNVVSLGTDGSGRTQSILFTRDHYRDNLLRFANKNS